eukprot:366203-Chlamydomonas_euryale.AAC.16
MQSIGVCTRGPPHARVPQCWIPPATRVSASPPPSTCRRVEGRVRRLPPTASGQSILTSFDKTAGTSAGYKTPFLLPDFPQHCKPQLRSSAVQRSNSARIRSAPVSGTGSGEMRWRAAWRAFLDLQVQLAVVP